MRNRSKFIRRTLTGCAVALMPWAFTQSFDALSTTAEARSLEEQTTTNWDDGFDPSVRPTAITEGENVKPMLGPETVEAMQGAIALYQIIVRRGGWPKIPGGHTLVPGMNDRRVQLLTHRLMITGDLVPPEGFDANVYDANVQQAVINFQIRHGMLAHGKVDEKTRKALNIPASVRLKTLETNLERARKYARGLQGRYVVVNIPATELETVEDGYLYARHVTVVGKVDRPTPEVASHIVELNFNPYWHAPISIAEKDIIPQLRTGLSYLRKLNIKVFEGSYYGTEVDPSSVDWSKASAKKYFFRQEPGKNNAMATMRINFPNEHDVYLHDTPGKGLFAQAVRYDSSGCIRVDQVDTFVNWLLRGQSGWQEDRVAELAETRERQDVELTRKVPLRIVYLTAWATSDGGVHFRRDIYGRDGPAVEAANGTPAVAVAEPTNTGSIPSTPDTSSTAAEDTTDNSFSDAVFEDVR